MKAPTAGRPCASAKLSGLPFNATIGGAILFKAFDDAGTAGAQEIPCAFPSALKPASSPSPEASPTPCAIVPLVNEKCPAWVSSYDGPAHGPDSAGEGLLNSRVMATSPDGQSVYVAGTSDGNPGSGRDYDYVVIAFNTATGEQRWTSRYPGPADLPGSSPFALVVSPAGSAVFVTGNVYSADNSRSGIATVAFAAATGEQLWSALLNESSSTTTDAAISPDGTRVYVVGQVNGKNQDGTPRSQAVTIAYDAATGAQVWLQHAGETGDRTFAFKVAANPDGTRLYVAGGKLDAGGMTSDVLLLVYEAPTGDLLRETHHLTSGFPPAGIAVSQDGSRVFIEEANYETSLNNALTLAYDAAGNELWTARFRGCDEFKCSSRPWYYGPITVSPDGTRVFVTSLSVNRTVETGFVTVAYDAATGEQEWMSRYEANVGDCFCGPIVTAHPNGQEVYITGFAHSAFPITPGTSDATTVAYDPATGAQKWVAVQKQGAAAGFSDAIAASPDGRRVFIAGGEGSPISEADLVAVAYDTGLPPLVSVASSKNHRSAGAIEIPLPLAGTLGIECRSGGANGDHTIIFTFANPLTSVGGASVTRGSGSVQSSMIGSDAHQYIVNLTGVANAQKITVSLSNVNDSAGNKSSSLLASMGILLGDSNADGAVNSGDAQQTRNRSGQLTSSTNFRSDVNLDGAINSGDAFIVRSKSGSTIDPPPSMGRPAGGNK